MTDERSRKPFIVWLVMVFLAAIASTALVVAWGVRQAMTDGPRLSEGPKAVFLFIAEFPTHLREAMDQFHHPSRALLVGSPASETARWKRSFPASEDTGYLLLAGVDPTVLHSTVRLIRISDGKETARWDPDWDTVFARTSEKRLNTKGSRSNMHAVNPLLLPDGDVVFNTSHALVRMSSCSAQPVWLLDLRMHHSNRLDPDGTIWTPSDAGGHKAYAGNAYLRDNIRDDSLARISQDGRLLENLSFTRILEDNGLGALVTGTSGANVRRDPVHLNEILPAQGDGRYWKKGDLLLSSRHLSGLFLYRPSTGRIVWHRIGPWTNQHAPEFLDDHRISVFDNNLYAGAPDAPFLHEADVNRVLVYDFDTDRVSEPFKDLLAAEHPRTFTQGRARILPDGGLYVEETNMGRHLRFTKERLLWSRVNDLKDGTIGVVDGSSYLTAEEAEGPLKALGARKCGGVS